MTTGLSYVLEVEVEVQLVQYLITPHFYLLIQVRIQHATALQIVYSYAESGRHINIRSMS